ncbi:MAG TPA: hypothetical protein VGG10_17215 [Rhizomicrobium sp.]
MTTSPSHRALDRIAAQMRARPVAWRRVEGGYTAAERWVLQLDDGRSLFAKLATNDNTVRWIRAEHFVYERIAGDFLPRLLGFDDGDYPLLLLEDLSGGSWYHEWTAANVQRVCDLLARVAATKLPADFPIAKAPLDGFIGWQGIAKAPEEFLALGLVTPAWLAHALPALLAAEAALDFSGDALLHFDVRSDNLCFLPDGRTILVDWNWAGRGNAAFDLIGWLPSLQAEGGPAPWTILPDAGPAMVTALCGYFAVRAGAPPQGSPIRNLQTAQLKCALPWTARVLDLPPPGNQQTRRRPMKMKNANAMKNGWSVAVSGQSSNGVPKTRHYVVAIEDEAKALSAVEAVIEKAEVATISSPVGANLLELRNILPGEVRMLGGAVRRRPAGT